MYAKMETKKIVCKSGRRFELDST